jgi:hypothetical protein
VLEQLGEPDAFPEWLPDVLECRVLRESATERFVYIETHAAVAGLQRDGVYHFTFAGATVRVEALPDYVPRRAGRVRVTRSDGYWAR